MELKQEYTYDIENRFKYLAWIVSIVFLIILGRLYYLQIVSGTQYRMFSEQNSIKEIKIPALRGMIYDKNGLPVVDGRPAFDVVVVQQYVQDKKKMISSLSEILNMTPEDVQKKIEKESAGMPSYYPIIVKSDVSFDEMSAIKAFKTPTYEANDRYDLRGIDVVMRYARSYADGFFASHLLGYLREIDPDRLKKYQEQYPLRYSMGDFVGIGGVEEVWDNLLRGHDGFDQKIVNAVGREVEWSGIELIRENPVNGGSIKLTIDKKLQEVAKEEFAGKSGALVAIDPRDGSVLALYSAPSYDLNLMSSSEGGKYWNQLSIDPKKTLYNRAIQGTYPPGSTFKIVTAAAGLTNGDITPQSKITCTGGVNFGGRFYQCWRKGGHGSINVIDAITASCDSFFYQLALRSGVDVIAKLANLMGLGHTDGIDIPGEKSGNIPTSEWKMKRFGVPWQAGENLSIGIGQGYVTESPLQNAMMISTVANGGRKIQPHLVSEAFDENGNRVFVWNSSDSEQVLDPSVVATLKKGLEGVVNSPSGTGHRLSSLGLKLAGKTGTAQVIAKEKWGKIKGEEAKDHAWFVGYAPYDDPKIAVAVIVEHGGFGASAAAPIVGKVVQAYLGKQDVGGKKPEAVQEEGQEE